MLPHRLSRGTGPMNESIHGERTASELEDRVTELIEQQTAISEVLRAIASSPHDLQPIFDAILDSARRLCRVDLGYRAAVRDMNGERPPQVAASFFLEWPISANTQR